MGVSTLAEWKANIEMAAESSKNPKLAEELGDQGALAAASRELGCLQVARVRAWFVERIKVGEHMAVMARVAGGKLRTDTIELDPARDGSARLRDLRNGRELSGLLVLEGELHTELQDGRSFVLIAGQSYQVADGTLAHRSRTDSGAKLFIVD
jgi:hypothetical protein